MLEKLPEKGIAKNDPEFPVWCVGPNASDLEIKVAEKMLLAYDRSDVMCTAIAEKNKAEGRNWHSGLPNQGVLAKDCFIVSLTKEEASLPFTRMLITFGPILHWNDVADVCFWTLGFNIQNGWNDWFDYKNAKGLGEG